MLTWYNSISEADVSLFQQMPLYSCSLIVLTYSIESKNLCLELCNTAHCNSNLSAVAEKRKKTTGTDYRWTTDHHDITEPLEIQQQHLLHCTILVTIINSYLFSCNYDVSFLINLFEKIAHNGDAQYQNISSTWSLWGAPSKEYYHVCLHVCVK